MCCDHVPGLDLGTTLRVARRVAVTRFKQHNTSCLYPVYVRGEAYLAAGQGSAAAAEFQRILDHSGIVWNCWTGALAHLGVARANALQSRTSQGADADQLENGTSGSGEGRVPLWGVVAPSRIHRDQPGDPRPDRGALLRQLASRMNTNLDMGPVTAGQ